MIYVGGSFCYHVLLTVNISVVCFVHNFKYSYLDNLQNYYSDSLCIKTNCFFASTVYSHFASVVLDVCDRFNCLISHSVPVCLFLCHLCSALVANEALKYQNMLILCKVVHVTVKHN